ncbi:MAG: LysM peptidoglycan-binding domain-containing protein [Bacillota bacterium]|nr:LysM peptidoglycan-binding domain-containing protein [Bacillota bacterium]MDW7682746.1 LysM peptidoglycan-binding domain-containing protein [Bacillota bacterium]
MRKSVTGIFVVVMLVFVLVGQAVAAVHVVRPGETLWLISQKYGTTVADLARANSLVNVNYIEVGQQLSVPGEKQVVHTVRAGETLWTISRHYNSTVAAIAAENLILNVNLIKVGDRLVIPGITAPSASVPVLAPGGGRSFTAAELDLFARIVHAESAGEPYTGQVAVAATILNRVDSPRYPNTLRDVVYQVDGGYYQYSPVLDGRIDLPANDSARRAVQDAINGADPSLGATGFYNPAKTSNQWVRQQPVTTVIANHVFFR